MIAVLLFSLYLNFSPLTVPKAHAWETYITMPLGVMLTNMISIVKGVLLGSLKQAAVKAINGEISAMVGGSSSGNAMFVTDWQDYLIKQPEQKTKVYLNAYIDQATSGRGSLSQYIPAGSEGVGLSGSNYNNQLKTGATASIVNPADPKVTYAGDPSQMFAQGNFRNLSLYLSGINNPWAFNLHIQEKFDETRKNEQLTAAEKVRAGAGFIGKESDGKTITPGILIKEQMAGVQNMGKIITATATNIPEVITAVVSQMAIQSIQQGVGKVQANIQKEVTTAQNQASNQQNSAIQQYGPGAQYGQKWSLGASSASNCSVTCTGTGAHYAATCASTENGTAACPTVAGKQYCCVPK